MPLARICAGGDPSRKARVVPTAIFGADLPRCLRKRGCQFHHTRDESTILRLEQASRLPQNFGVLLTLQVNHASAL